MKPTSRTPFQLFPRTKRRTHAGTASKVARLLRRADHLFPGVRPIDSRRVDSHDGGEHVVPRSVNT